jgi:hypothetical protein
MRRSAAALAAESKESEQVRPPHPIRGASASSSASAAVASADAAAGEEDACKVKDLQRRLTAVVDMAGVGRLRSELVEAVGEDVKGNGESAQQLRLLDAVQRK